MRKILFLPGILVMIGAIALIVGCSIEQKEVPEEEAIVAFAIGQDTLFAKTIEPEVSMDIKTFSIKGYKKNSSGGFDLAINVPAATADDSGVTVVYLLVVPGQYYFVITGINGAGDEIGEGTYGSEASLVDIVPKKKHEIFVTVTPKPGTGTLNVTVEWPGVYFDSVVPLINAVITPMTGTEGDERTVSFDVDVGVEHGTFVTDGLKEGREPLANGYYRFKLKMIDPGSDPVDTADDVTLWSTVDALRIVSGFESKEIYTLVKELDAFVPIQITEDMNNPFEISFNIDPDASGTEFGLTWYDWDKDKTTDPPYVPLPDYIMVPKDKNIWVYAYPYDPVTGANIALDGPDSFEWYVNFFEDRINPASASITYDAAAPAFQWSRLSIGADFPEGVYWIDVLMKKDGVIVSRRVKFIVQ